MYETVRAILGKNEAHVAALRCVFLNGVYRLGLIVEVVFHLYAMVRECRKAVFILSWIPSLDIFDHAALLLFCLACVTLHGSCAGLVVASHFNIVPATVSLFANDADRHYHALLCISHFVSAGMYLGKAAWYHYRDNDGQCPIAFPVQIYQELRNAREVELRHHARVPSRARQQNSSHESKPLSLVLFAFGRFDSSRRL
ncbi:hypothetical protein BIW11_09224 [Tropilaelaps mercedesae]|uniref:Uncharacterized protein n=1 Tax=Tropilaelaps mercedesae TaxID=418985 RepID=A0A1V9XKY7_9ACAR|nr:hypothetical protein BIW11_09224 [Tropilaelaps mercedesae]